MNAIHRFAVAVLVAVLGAGLSGCVTSFPSVAPDLPEDVRSQPAFQEMQRIPVYVTRPTYYDASNIMEIAEKSRKDNRKIDSFMKEFPVLPNPPASLTTSGAKLVVGIKTTLVGMGFRVVDEPCETCLIVIPDYAEHLQLRKVIFGDEKRTFIFASARLYYRNQEIAAASSDMVQSWLTGPIALSVPGRGFDDTIYAEAGNKTKEIIKKSYSSIVSWKQQFSAVQQ